MSTNAYIERLNWANDRRNTGDMTKPVMLVISGVEQELPTNWVVCPVCDGKGTTVNPSIDCGGLTADDFYEDECFAEDYLSGTFDIPCNACGGRTTVRQVDESRLNPVQLAAWKMHQKDEEEYRALCRSEYIYGC